MLPRVGRGGGGGSRPVNWLDMGEGGGTNMKWKQFFFSNVYQISS